MDKIIIRDLRLATIIGTMPEERNIRQEVVFNLDIFTDLSEAGKSDDLNDTVDYKAMKLSIIEMVEKSEFFLIEKLAQETADICLANPRVKKVRVCLDKPGALRFTRSVAVEIERTA